ncbi:MAG: PolC-type DNA polymerase III, partial [Oscillibacter sp.]
MAKKIPFFNMFSDLMPPQGLRGKLTGADLTGVVIDQSQRTIALQLTAHTALTPADEEELKALLTSAYGFAGIDLTCRCEVPVPVVPDGGSKSGKPAVKATKILMGNLIKGKPTPMSALDLKMGNATVTGKVFAAECRETRRPGMWRLSFDMTDYTNSVTVQKNLTAKEAKKLENAIEPGIWL